MEVYRSHRLPRRPEIYCNFRQQVKWAKNAAGFPGILKSPEHRSCKATDKERAWLDRIGLSDVSFSVANKPNRRINRERKGNNLSIVVHSELTAHTSSKEGRQAGVPSQGLEAQSEPFTHWGPRFSWLSEVEYSSVTCFVKKKKKKWVQVTGSLQGGCFKGQCSSQTPFSAVLMGKLMLRWNSYHPGPPGDWGEQTPVWIICTGWARCELGLC